MYLFSKLSKRGIVHHPGCSYLSKTLLKNVSGFREEYQSKKAGYHLCRHCMENASRISGMERSLFDFCRKNGFSFREHEGHICVDTPSSSWKIVLSEKEGGLALYHKNDFSLKKDVNSPVPGFHRQKCHAVTFTEYSSYIVSHDEFRRKNPVSKPKEWEKTLPKQYTRKYNKVMKQIKKRTQRASVKRTLDIIDTLRREREKKELLFS